MMMILGEKGITTEQNLKLKLENEGESNAWGWERQDAPGSESGGEVRLYWEVTNVSRDKLCLIN